LDGSREEGLLIHVLQAEHASKAQAVVLLSLRKRAFNCFFAPLINSFANGRFRKPGAFIQSILPNMSGHHPSRRFCRETFLSSRTLGALFGIAEILTVPLPGCRPPIQRLLFWTKINVEVSVIAKTPLTIVFACVRMPAVTDHALNTSGFKQMGYGCIMITGIQSHILWKHT